MYFTMGEKVKNSSIRLWVGVSRHQGWASLGLGVVLGTSPKMSKGWWVQQGRGGSGGNVRVMTEKGSSEQSEESRNNFTKKNTNMYISYIYVYK